VQRRETRSEMEKGEEGDEKMMRERRGRRMGGLRE
jgi:hypothetical protein